MTARIRLIYVAVLCGLPVTTLASEPFTPANDETVLETLTFSLLERRSEITELRQEIAANPTNETIAVHAGQRFVAMGNQAGDPRFYGYAHAAIRHWWKDATPPAEILALRAKLKEKDHRYDEALADLHKLLTLQPQNAQALIEVANIYRVQGKYENAFEACERLSQFAGRVPTTLCRAPLQAATGKARDALESIEAALPEAKAKWPNTVAFMDKIRVQIAQSLGDTEHAEQYFRDSLQSNPRDSYTLRAYADFLLDQERNDEAFALAKDHVQDNGLLLRAAIAADRIGEELLSKKWQKELQSRFEEIRLRGGRPHGRFESRFLLELKREPRSALRTALSNWEKQKELRDTRNVLEAALAANEPSAAQPVVSFLEKYGTEDVILRRLVDQLEFGG